MGEIGIDQTLLADAGEDVALLPSGCLCCTLRNELSALLELLLRRLDNGRISPFRRLVIETTGPAHPAPVMATIIAHPDPVAALSVGRCGHAGRCPRAALPRSPHRHEEARRQVAMADTLVLTRTTSPRPMPRSLPGFRS